MKYILERFSRFNEIKLRYLFFCFLCDILATKKKETKAKGTGVKRKAQA
jgi:hypothetical protein